MNRHAGRLATAALIVLLAVAFGWPEEAGALTTPINEWILSGETITVEEQSFTIHLSSRLNEVVADYGKGSLFIRNNSCEATALAMVCIDNIQYDYTDKAYKLRVRGVSLAPILSITREASKTELLAGDEAVFTVTLKNTGGLARNMTFTDRFPKEFVVTEADGATAQLDRAVWKGRLDEGESETFSYKVKADDIFDGGLVASLTYSDGLRLKTLYTSKIDMKSTSPVKIISVLGRKATLIGETNNITINVTNRLAESAIAAVRVQFDNGIKVVSRPYGIKVLSPQEYEWTGEIARVTNRTTNTTNLSNAWINLTKTLFFEFKSQRTGSSDIATKVTYYSVSNPSNRSVTPDRQSVTASNKDVIIRTSIEDETIETNQRKNIKIWLQNLNPYVKLKEVKANISTDLLYLPDGYIAEMGLQEQAILANAYFYAPAVDKGKGYVVTTNVSYLTEFGDNFSKTSTSTVSVVPLQEVTLTQAIPATTMKEDEELEVSVTVKNSRPTGIRNVKVHDNVSDGFTIIGKSTATITVGSKESVKAYTYKVRAPHVEREKTLHINTTAEYSDEYNTDDYLSPQGYILTKTAQVTVGPQALPITISRETTDTDIYAGEEFDVKYAITNTAKDRTAMNIAIKLPLSYFFDFIGGKEDIIIPFLGPGETVTLPDTDRRVAKVAGSNDLPQATMEYENSYGSKYYANSTALTVAVKENYAKGPTVFIDKTAPSSVNNTDAFNIIIKLTNTGTEPADVRVEDEGAELLLAVPNGTERLINRSQRHATPGVIKLPQAIASYTYNGVTRRTSSNQPSIEITDNPFLGIEKSVPGQATNVEPYTATITVTNRQEMALANVTIADGERKWNIPLLEGKAQANVTYEAGPLMIGRHQLGPAAATYYLGNTPYTASSKSPVLNVEAKELVAISKKVSPETARPGEKVKIRITAKNIHTTKLDITAEDGKKAFTATLNPGQEKEFAYETEAAESSGEAATITYAVKGQEVVSLSPKPQFTLATNESARPAEQRQARSGSAIARMLRAILNILTWKRGE